MKNDLSCEVVRDLLPSYLDGVASGETKAAVERHMEECPDCRETLRRMKEPEETALTEEKEIDYLKKVRRRSSRKVAVILGIVVLLSMAAMFRLFYIGFPVDSRAIAAVVTVRDGTVRLTGTLTDSGQSVCRANITQNEDGGVEVQMYAALPLFAHSGDLFRRGRFRRASGGPFFSALPEKNGEKRGARLRLVHIAGAIQAGTCFLVVTITHSHPTRVLVRAACYGTAQFVSRCV